MKIQTIQKRTGFSLLEVLISLLIMLIGVTSVIALFPVAISRVRQAVLDTRCTFIGRSMWEVVDLKGMENDPLHLDPSPPANTAPDPPHENFLQAPFYGDPNTTTPGDTEADSYYFNVVIPGSETDPPDGLSLLDADCDTGIPLLIDPLWVEAARPTPSVSLNGVGWDANRQTVARFPTNPPFDSNPHPLRVVTTWEAASIADETVRQSYIRRWFTSDGDIQYRDEFPGIPLAPANQNIYHLDISGGLPLADSEASARRTYPYSWALMMMRDVDPNTGGTNGTDPPLLTGEVDSRLLVFYKRNLADPVDYAMGAFVDGDNRVTLRYDPADKPDVRRGTWLLECTIAGKTNADRRSFKFHRVADAEDAIVDGIAVIAVTLESDPSGYNVGPRAIGAFPDEAPGGAIQYYPVYILDGLQEVYGRPIY